ncbi:MAG: hypothetical protein J0I43_03540 [Microbacterium sp.]|uniref:hypothetical protein n=1 Tax=Microbacterium sp. TaxID=51671 RepID=UPI001AD3FF26|nr:hypothetical protein [Microbacterium sp.]MBN9176426.1 hypothetical protein [Microbacterium sp.]
MVPGPPDGSPDVRVRDALVALLLLGLAVVAPFVAAGVYADARGDWAMWIGPEGVKGSPTPMWLSFGMWCFLGLMGLAGTSLFVVGIVRHVRARRSWAKDKSEAR